NARSDVLDRTHRVSGVINGNPIDILKRGQHLRAQLGIEYRPPWALVDEAVSRHRDDQHVAQLTGGLEMAHVSEMQQIESAVSLHDGLAGAPTLIGYCGDFGQASDLIAWAGRSAKRRPADQLCDASVHCRPPTSSQSVARKRNQSLVASAMRDAVHTGASCQ